MPEDITQKLRDTVRTVPDFPIDGIMFRDITPVLSDGSLLSATTDLFIERMNEAGWKPDAIIGPEACLLYTSPSPRDATLSRMPSSA